MSHFPTSLSQRSGFAQLIRIAWLSLLLITTSLPLVQAQNLAVHAPFALKQSTNKLSSHEDNPLHSFVFIWWNRTFWDSLSQEYFSYDGAGNLTSYQTDQYDGLSFVPQARHTTTFTNQGQKAEEIIENWTGTAWENYVKQAWYYDQNGNDTLNVQEGWVLFPWGYGWDTTSGGKSRITYGVNNQIASLESSSWVAGQPEGYWRANSRKRYHFNPMGQWDSLTYAIPFGNVWVDNLRLVDVIWSNYALQQASQSITQQYQGGAWNNFSKDSCVYSGLDTYCYTANPLGNVWEYNMFTNELVDFEGHTYLYVVQDYPPRVGGITIGRQYLYTYDSLGRTLEMVSQIFQDTTLGYINNTKYVYDRFFLVNAEEPRPSALEVALFPNPCQTAFEMRWSKPSPAILRLYDLQGRLRLEHSNPRSENGMQVVLGSALGAGTYIYQLETRSGTASGRLVLQR